MSYSDEAVVEVRGLQKAYGKVEAVRGVDLTIRRGDIFGILGHNGAGKTTTIECILGTRQKDAGSVSVLGMDPVRDRKKLFTRVAVQFQQSAFQDKIRVREICETTAALYEHPKDWQKLLAEFQLLDKQRTPVNGLSGGERQKLAVVLARIPGAELLFLDELTTGLDPQARREMWDSLKELNHSGITIVLISHYMDEVAYLCNRIVVMKEGRLIARGTPETVVNGCAAEGAKNLEDAFLTLMEKKI